MDYNEHSLNDTVFNNDELNDLLTNSSFMASVEGMDQAQTDCYGLVTGNIPSRDDFPGEFLFTFTLGDSTTGGLSWVFSPLLEQLFIGMNKTFVVHFNLNFNDSYINSLLYIRALPVYSSDDFINVPVIRCTMHSADDDPQGQAHQQQGFCFCNSQNKYVGHVVRAECKEAQYLYDERTDRHSVRVPVTGPQPGSERISIPFSFACKTSCPKGMQRRPIHVIFTLEDPSGQVLGRQKLGVKICSCPKRDKKRQEDDYKTDERGVGKKRKRFIDEGIPITNQVKVETFENTTLLQKDEINNKLDKEIIETRDLMSKLAEMHSTMSHAITELQYKMQRIEELHGISHLE